MKLHGKAKELDRLHLEYEDLLIAEINNLCGLATGHGWKSQLYQAGKAARKRLKEAGSKIKLPDADHED